MKKAQKILYIFITTIEVLMLIGAYLINYFTESRMGMMRYVSHKNYVLENTYPMLKIVNTTSICISIIALIVLAIYIKRKKQSLKIVNTIAYTMIAVVLVFMAFTFIYSVQDIRAYYFIWLIGSIISVLQIIMTLIASLVYKR